MACSLCGSGTGRAKPHAACDEGQQIYENLVEARIRHDKEKLGEETFSEWQKWWRKWDDHWRSRRSKQIRKNKRKQQEKEELL